MTWEAVYRGHWRPVVRWVRRRTPAGADAEGIAQAAFVRVWRQFPAPPASDRLVRWHLIRAAREEAGMGRNRVGPHAPLLHLAWRAGGWAGVADWLPDDLDPRARAAAMMVCDEGCTLHEVAARLGVSRGTAQAAWRRAVSRAAAG